MENELKNKTFSGFVWHFMQKSVGQLLSFAVTVVLARLLTPDDYGVVALAGMFNVLAGIFVSFSLDMALVQKKDVDELDYNTVFYASLLMSFVVYLVVFFCAPIISNIYDNELITPIIRTMALTMLLTSVVIVQNSIVLRQMKFKKFFYITLIGQTISGGLGILLALDGYGPWALVFQTIAGAVANACTLTFMVRWFPKLLFSWERFKSLFAFAWRRSAAGLMGTFCNQLKGYMIGYQYTASDLAYFNRGEGLPDMLKNNIVGTMDGVLFPAFSRIQDDVQMFKRGMRKTIIVANYVLVPVMFGLAAVSGNIVPLLYSSQWNPAIPFMQISCLTVCVVAINNTNLQALYALGRTDEVLRIEYLKKIVMLFILFVAISISPLAISVGFLLHSCHELFWTIRSLDKYIEFSIKEQLLCVMPASLLAFFMAAGVYLIGLLFDNVILSLVIQIVFGASFYIAISHRMKMEGYVLIKQKLQEKFKKY